MTRQHYTPEQRAEAVGLAMTVGARAAGRQTGIPFGLIARWSKRPDLVPVLLESRQQVADRLWLTIQEGTSAVLEGLKDPKQRLSDRASALRVAIEAHALLTGTSTANIATSTTTRAADALTPEEQEQASAFLRMVTSATDDELRAYIEHHGLRAMFGKEGVDV